MTPVIPRDDLDHQVHLKSDEELLDLARMRVASVYRLRTTCRMAIDESLA